MIHRNQIDFNGNFIPIEDADFSYNNRAFLYGDSIFETIRVNDRHILFFEEHLNRLVAGMRILKYEIPEIFLSSRKQLENEITSLLNRNKIFNSSRVRITVFRKSGGFFTPITNSVDYVITANQLNEKKFYLNDKGLIIGIYDEVKKPINLFSSYKTANSLIYILAGIFKNLNKYDDCLILNEKGHLIEAVSSNIFIVKNGVLYTPPITEACIDGIMRKQVINIAKKNEISFAEQPLFVDDLLKADEVFLTNSISGIQWAAAYKNKRYFKKISEFLLRKVNESVA